jgi:hypothetical protein
MRSFPALIASVALLGSATRSQTTAASALALRPDQVPTDCSMVDGSFPVDIQTAILWEKPDLYQTVIPPPIAKNAQSFAGQGDKGTVYSFQFSDAPKRKTAAAFIKPLLWGESGQAQSIRSLCSKPAMSSACSRSKDSQGIARRPSG